MNEAIAQNLLYTEHNLWLKNLDQLKAGCKDLQGRLELLITKFKKPELLARIEQFQNRFIRQREVIDELRHEIKQHENHLEQNNFPSHILLLEHNELREKYSRFYDLFIELERDFDEFLV